MSALAFGCNGGGYPAYTDGSTATSILGAWEADPVAGAHVTMTLSGGEASGTLTFDQTVAGGLPGCITHSISQGTFTRSGDASGNLEIVPTSGTGSIGSCTDPANNRDLGTLTADQLALGHGTGTYELSASALDAHLVYPQIGAVEIAFTRPH